MSVLLSAVHLPHGWVEFEIVGMICATLGLAMLGERIFLKERHSPLGRVMIVSAMVLILGTIGLMIAGCDFLTALLVSAIPIGVLNSLTFFIASLIWVKFSPERAARILSVRHPIPANTQFVPTEE
jgi:hypothetical protein